MLTQPSSHGAGAPVRTSCSPHEFCMEQAGWGTLCLHPCPAGRACQRLCSPGPGSSGSVPFRWSWRSSVLPCGCEGCLGKGGFYRGLSCGWEVVNPCERAKHKGESISGGSSLLHRVKQASVVFMLHPLGIVCMALQTEPCNKTDGSVRRCQEKLCCFSPLPVHSVMFLCPPIVMALLIR